MHKCASLHITNICSRKICKTGLEVALAERSICLTMCWAADVQRVSRKCMAGCINEILLLEGGDFRGHFPRQRVKQRQVTNLNERAKMLQTGPMSGLDMGAYSKNNVHTLS